MALTGVALGGSLLSPLTAEASPAHAQPSGAGFLGDDTAHSDWADRTDRADRADYNDSDDSDDGDSDDGFDGSDEGSDGSDGGYSDDAGSGYRSRPAHTVAPHVTHETTRRPVRNVAHRSSAQASGRAVRGRPMSSGEEQYRNGCRQGYIVQDCGQFDVPHLLQRGINPYL